MKSAASLWIDHPQASIITPPAEGVKRAYVTSDVEDQVCFPGNSRQDGPGTLQQEDHYDRRFGNRLSQYYDQVITVFRVAEAIPTFVQVSLRLRCSCGLSVRSSAGGSSEMKPQTR